MTKLCPAQQKAFDHLLEALEIGQIFVVWSHDGMGRTTLLEELHRLRGGEFLTMKDYIDDLRVQNPMAMEETLEHMLMRSLGRNDFVVMDDLSLIYQVVCGCGYGDSYPRAKFVEAILTSMASHVLSTKKTIVFGIEGTIPSAIWNRSYCSTIGKFSAEDYRFILESYLGDKATDLDFKKIYRFAPKLNAHQLKGAALWLQETEDLDTEKLIEYMRSQRMGSNVDLEEVEAVELSSLRGVNDIIESLEANIIIPLERDDLATEFDIKPKRGVLLAGESARFEILRDHTHRLPSELRQFDARRAAEESDGLTGADLKRLIEDAKILYAFDRAKSRTPGETYSYFERSMATIRSNREKYEQAEHRAKAKVHAANPFAFMAERYAHSATDDDDFPTTG